MLRSAILSFKATGFATVNNLQALPPFLNGNRFHCTPAGCSAIAGMNINMPAPQTYRAVVGVPVAVNLLTAVQANKGLNGPLKFS